MSRARVDANSHIRHLFYELRMLLGSKNMCRLAEENNWGNTVNYFKDSAYIHIRNLYSFFTDRTRDDVSIQDFGLHCMYSDLYSQKSEAINRRVMHISPSRPKRNETIEPVGSEQLNELILDFVTEIETMWEIWLSLTDDPTIKNKLSAKLEKARSQAADDMNRVYTANTKGK